MILYRLPETNWVYDTGLRLPVGTKVKIVLTDVIDGVYSDLSAYEADVVDDEIVSVNLSDFSFYDRTVVVQVHDSNGNPLHESFVEIVRPYATPDPSLTAEEKAEFWKQEALARAVIDSITGGFKFKKKIVSYESLGGDVISLQEDIIRILRGWENGELVYAPFVSGFSNKRDFFISRDRSTIIIDDKPINRRTGNDTTLDWAPSDYLGSFGYTNRQYDPGMFTASHDFLFEVEVGYRLIPPEVTLATNMIIEAGVCTGDYLNRYIKEYDTDQYRIKYHDSAFASSTGIRNVDLLLSRFLKGAGRLKAGVM